MIKEGAEPPRSGAAPTITAAQAVRRHYLIADRRAIDVADQIQHDPGTCNSGPHCRAHNGRTAHPTSDPLCSACLEAAGPAVRGLVFDYLDLAQLHEASLSQAITEKTSGGGHESPTLLADQVEALQAEIVHVTAMWEYELRVACRLHNPHTYVPLWRSTVYDTLNLIKGDAGIFKARPGSIVQRSTGIIVNRIRKLAALPETLVCPTGIDDEPVLMAGWEAVHQLQHLHKRSRAMLGRTTRVFWIPGECWTCEARPTPGVDGPLYRSEPKEFDDPMQVTCTHCHASRPYPDYETYMLTLLWPGQDTDADVQVAA